VLLTFYEFFQFFSKLVKEDLEVIFYIRFSGIVVLSPITLYLVYLVYQEFGWRDFKTVGSDPKLLELYRQFNRFVSFLEIDLQLGASLATFGIVGFFIIEEQPIFSLFETVAYGVYVGVTVLWVFLGYYGVRRTFNFPSLTLSPSLFLLLLILLTLLFSHSRPKLRASQ